MNFIPLLFYIISFLLLLAYSYIIIVAVHGTKSTEKTQTIPHKKKIPVDIIIAFHNEAKYLPQLIKNLGNQTYQNFRIIWVDDHSSDNSLDIVNSQFNRTNSISLSSKSRGKKAAIHTALAHTKAPLILFTDADCKLPTQWVENYVNQYEQHGDGLFIGSVVYNTKNNLEEIFALEFLSLIGTGIGLAYHEHPVYMNGANFGISQNLIQNTSKQSGLKYASGDDVFLLHDIKSQHGTDKIQSVPINGNSVKTKAPETIAAFLKQRIRWGGKANGYKDKEALILSGLIFSICLFQVASFIFISHIISFAALWIIKVIVDFFALATYSKAFKQIKILRWFIILAPLYPFYIIIAGTAGIFTSPNYWGKTQ